MKAHISQTGMLHITPENDTEAYALAQWHREHYSPDFGGYVDRAMVIQPYEPKSRAAATAALLNDPPASFNLLPSSIARLGPFQPGRLVGDRRALRPYRPIRSAAVKPWGEL